GQVLSRLRQVVGEPYGPAALQAPVSFRVAGPVLAHLLRAAAGLAGAIGRALSGVTDSPAFLGGTFVGTAGFHGLDLAAHCDQLTAHRAMTLSPYPVPPGCRPLMAALAGVIGPIEADRPFGEDIERLTAASWPPGPGTE